MFMQILQFFRLIVYVKFLNSQICFWRSRTYLETLLRCIYYYESWVCRSNRITWQLKGSFPTSSYDDARLCSYSWDIFVLVRLYKRQKSCQENRDNFQVELRTTEYTSIFTLRTFLFSEDGRREKISFFKKYIFSLSTKLHVNTDFID